MYLKSGYKTITGVQLLNGLALLEAKRISFRCFRVYLASFAATAVREAAARARRKNKVRGGVRIAHYRICELARLCGVTEGQARRDLRTLATEKLLIFSDSEIVAPKDILPESEDLVSLVRSPTRPVPVPRAVLRFLARGKRRAVSKVMIAYMLRGLTLARKGGEISGKGSVKLSWISTVAGVSERGAAYARKEIIRIGWISPDTGSTQWKLNRHGVYFSINLEWAPGPEPEASHPAPRSSESPPLFAAPNKDRKTPYGSKNQKASEAGVSEETGEGDGREVAARWNNVQPEDLFRVARCESLYWEAVERRIIEHSDCSALNFLAAAIRARSIKRGDPCRVFVSIVRRALWGHITFDQEEMARRALIRIREGNPDSFRRSCERRAADLAA